MPKPHTTATKPPSSAAPKPTTPPYLTSACLAWTASACSTTGANKARPTPYSSSPGAAAGATNADTTLHVGSLSYDTLQARFHLDGRRLTLTAQEERILAYLMHQPGTVVSRGEILEHVYARDSDPDSNALDVLISRIRRKLGVPLLHTIRGRGFMLAAETPKDDA